MKFRALRVVEEENSFKRSIITRDIEELPENDVLINVKYSSLNYKDSLSATGNRGVTRSYPHTPGIDAAGEVQEDRSGTFQVGEKVIVTSYDLGMNTDGGFSEYIRVPAAWVVRLPEGLSLKESMQLGSAGFTAALALHKMQVNGQNQEMGKILVTGASGGVGTLACSLLSKLGYQVIAATGKPAAKDLLLSLGVSQIIGREEVDDQSGKPLLRPKWAGAIDNVGGNILSTVIKACMKDGNIAVIGNAMSPKWDATVFPFILNGVNLLGVDSATCGMALRESIWKKLAGEWKPFMPEELFHEVSLDQVFPFIDRIRHGELMGRAVVTI